MHIMRVVVKFALLLIVATLLGSASTYAQTATGEVSGTVTDQTGAAIPQASVTLSSENTSVNRTAVSNQDGRFIFTNVLTGSYSVRVQASGFKETEQTNVTVQVNQIVALNYALSIGSVAEKVEVAGAAPALQTQSSALGTVIDTRAVNELPLNGRNFTQLLTLTPGVTPVQNEQGASSGTSYQQDVTIPGTPTFRPNVNGQWNRSNLYYLDGIWNSTNVASGYAITPIIESVEEFKVQSHNDDAEYGGSMGGTINLVSRSGTANLHGSAWEDLRNNFFDARDPFLDALTTGPAPYHQNEFGATIGGPVFIPKVYDGRKRTFFFFAYDGWRYSKPDQSFYYVPTAAELSGDFSQSIVHQNVYDPTTLTPSATAPSGFTVQQFPGNKIPSSRLNPQAVAFFNSYWDRPNYSNPALPQYNAQNNAPLTDTSNTYQIKIDENLGAKDTLSGRFTHFHTIDTNPITKLLSTDIDRPRVNVGGDWIHQFSQSVTLDAKFGYSRTPYIESTIFSNGSGPATSAGFAGSATYGVPALELQAPWGSPAGAQNQGGTGEAFINQQDHVYQSAATLSWLKGKHFFSGGFQSINQYYATPSYNQQFYAFNNSTTQDPNSVGTTGASLASALLGVPVGQTYIGQSWTESFTEWGFFFQDQWKFSPKLTINVGLRYDKLNPISNLNGTIFGGFDVNTGFYDISGNHLPPACDAAKAAPCIPGDGNLANIPEGNHIGLAPCASFRCPVNFNFGPHLGAAYSVNADTVIRGGYGLVYDEFAGFIQDMANHVGNWPAAQTVFQSINGTLGQPLTYLQSLQTLSAAPLPTAAPWGTLFWNADPKKQTPLSNQWNVEIQRQATRQLTLSVGYVGSSTHHMDYTGPANQAVHPSNGTQAQVEALRPWPGQGNVYFGRSIGVASYNGLQVSANQRMTDGLQFLISYTWSKATDNGASGFFASENGPGGGGAGVQDYYHPSANNGPSAFNVPQFLSTAIIYELPFGRGRQYLRSGPGAWILGGWQSNSIFSIRSGQPYSVLVNGDVANVGGTVFGIGYARANQTGSAHLSHPTTTEWFNTSAFSVPSYTYGNSPRNSLSSDHVTQFDFSMFKRFPIWKESTFLEFRAEAFNVLNIINYAAPNNTQNAAGFGTVTSLITGNPPRQLQFTLRVNF
jgi:Carboxypeptidase regulatory-like domain/TonB dependent receptor